MKSDWNNVTKQSNAPKGVRMARKWWMVLALALFSFPAPAWAQFKEPVLAEFTLGRQYEWAPTFSSDMLEVYWVVDETPSALGGWEIKGARRESIDASWEVGEPLDVINTEEYQSTPHLSTDGLTLTFASLNKEGGYGGLDLWQTNRSSRDAPWEEPVNMGPTINTRRNEANATFTADGLEVIFNGGCISWCSPTRLRRSTRETLADEWTTPEEMTPSGRGDEIGRAAHPTLSRDGLSLYFNRPGSFGDFDVYVSKRPSLDATFGPGENLGAPVSTSRRDSGVRIAPDGSLYHGLGEIWRFEAESIANLLGDFDNNRVLDVDDIDDLLIRVASGENVATYDLNNDASVDTEDIRLWVKDLANTWFGDANLDGEFNSGDMVDVFQAGKYEADLDAGWAEGDWNGDRRFDSGDMVAAFQDAGYESGPRAAVNAVPEPSSGMLLAVGAFCIFRTRRRNCRFAGDSMCNAG